MVTETRTGNVEIFDRLMVQRHKSLWAENAVAEESVALLRRGWKELRPEVLALWARYRSDDDAPVNRELRNAVVAIADRWIQGQVRMISAALGSRQRERLAEEREALVKILHPIIGEELREQAEKETVRSALKSGADILVASAAAEELLEDPAIWIEPQAHEAIVKMERGLNRAMAAGETALMAWGRMGEAVDQMATGVETVARNELETIVNGVSRETIEAVKDILPMEMWVATLDEKCCEVCASYDGEVWPVGEGPQPQVHPRCHCFRTPYNPNWDPLSDAERQAWFATEPGALAVGRRGELVKLPGRERRLRFKSDQPVRVPGRWEARKISTKVQYDDWFKRQPADVQKIILGPSRYELWKEGGEFSVKRFVDKGKVIPLAELSLS